MPGIRIGDITKIKTGKLDANASSVNGQYPFFTCAREPLKIDTYSYDCECVLVAGNGDLNVKYYNGKFDAYQRTYIIEDKSDGKLYLPYLYLFLDNYLEELRKQSIGGVIKYIKLGNLTDALIPLHNIEEQKEIVAILDKVNHLLAMRRRQLQFLDDLVKSRFVEMFCGKNFPEKSIRSFVDTKKISSKKRYNGDDTIKYIDISSIDNSINKIVGSTTYIFKDAPSRAQQCLQRKDILISTVRPNLKNIALFDIDDEGYVGSSGFCVLRAKGCAPEYLLHCVLSDVFTEEMISKTSGASYPAIRDDDVLDYKIFDAPLSLQKEFTEYVKLIDKSKFIIQKSIEKLETLQKALMQKYFG